MDLVYETSKISQYFPLSADNIMGIVALACLWTILFNIILKQKLPEKLEKPNGVKVRADLELDTKNRMVSIINGSIMVIFSIMDAYKNPGECASPNSAYQEWLIRSCIGYFIYDFFAMMYYGLLDNAMTIHHLAVILGLTLALIS